MAQNAGLVGHVCLRHDGKLSAMCEGEEKSIEEFIGKLGIHDGIIDVDNIEVKWSRPRYRAEYFCVKCPSLAAEIFWGFESLCRSRDNFDKTMALTSNGTTGR